MYSYVSSIEIFNSFFFSVKKFLKLMGTLGLLDSESTANFFLKLACSHTYIQARLCRYMFNQVSGPSRKNIALVIQH